MKPRLSQDEAVQSNFAVYAAGQLLLGWSFERGGAGCCSGDAGAYSQWLLRLLLSCH